MRQFIIGLIALALIGTSQASTMTTARAQTATATLAKIVTKKELVHVSSIRIPKAKLFRSNPFRKSFFINVALEDDDDIFIQDEDLATAFRRPDIKKPKELKDLTDDLPEYVRWRLFLARQLALMKYREKWA